MDKKILEGLKNRMSAPVIMLVVALLIALVVSFWSYGWLQQRAAVQTSPAVDTQQVVVSGFDLKWGTVLTNEVVKVQPYLKGSLPVGYVADPAAVIGRVVIYPIAVNEPITESKLAPVSVKSGGVAAVVTPKKRAMAVKVDKVIGVSGFIHPGNRVDVLVSLPKSDKTPNSITKTVLENLLVLAVGTEVEQASQKDKPAQVDVITLEVTPEEGEMLALAATEGKLQLALRNYMDTEDVMTRGTTIPTLLSAYAGTGPVKKDATARRTAPAAPASTITVELIKGNKVSTVNFNRRGE